LHQPYAVSSRSRRQAVAHPELGQNPGNVGAGRLLGDEQRLADLTVGAAFCQKRQHLRLTYAEAEVLS